MNKKEITAIVLFLIIICSMFVGAIKQERAKGVFVGDMVILKTSSNPVQIIGRNMLGSGYYVRLPSGDTKHISYIEIKEIK